MTDPHHVPIRSSKPTILAFATLGRGSNEEQRILSLLGPFSPMRFDFDRSRKLAMFWRILRMIRHQRPDLVVMEGTGVAGGLALICARMIYGRKFVVSSGDAVGPWVGGRVRLLGPLFGLYERILCRFADGFIGWTPYLAGRALTFGTPRVMTAAGWAPFFQQIGAPAEDRRHTRERLGIPSENIVIGIAGSLAWSKRYQYCYGRELVETARAVRRSDITFLIVGDGSGRPSLQSLVEDLPAGRIVFTGHVPQQELPKYYAAMDVASLPQSVDRVGSFRYTTKLSEYLRFRLPVITGQIPLAYDLDSGWLWRIPGEAPWDARYLEALRELVSSLNMDEVRKRCAAIPDKLSEFDLYTQVARVTSFVRDLLDRNAPVGEDATRDFTAPCLPIERAHYLGNKSE